MAEYGAPAARVAGGALGYFLSRKRPHRAELSAFIFSDIPVIHPHLRNSTIFSDAETELLGYPASTLHAATITVVNTGEIPIEAKKGIKPIRIEFHNKPVRFVRVDVKWRRSEQFDPDDDPIHIEEFPDKGSITLTPPLINPGDAFTVQVLVAETKPLKVHIKFRYPGAEAVEVANVGSASTEVSYQNTRALSQEMRWVWLRKFAPQKWKFRRASQLNDLFNHVSKWNE